jgi:hypothetical protein
MRPPSRKPGQVNPIFEGLNSAGRWSSVGLVQSGRQVRGRFHKDMVKECIYGNRSHRPID